MARSWGRLRCDGRGEGGHPPGGPDASATIRASRDPAGDDALRDLALELGFVYVDVSAVLRRNHDLADLVLSATDAHPNPLGHQLIADVLLPSLLKALRSRFGT